jgi:hypothetical protein
VRAAWHRLASELGGLGPAFALGDGAVDLRLTHALLGQILFASLYGGMRHLLLDGLRGCRPSFLALQLCSLGAVDA